MRTRWLRNSRHNRENPEYVCKLSIAGYLTNWRLVKIHQVFYTTIVPTSSGTVPLNASQYRHGHFFNRDGLAITFPDRLGKLRRGRPRKNKTEYQLLITMKGYGANWELQKIHSAYFIDGKHYRNILDLEAQGFNSKCIGCKIIIEEGLGVAKEYSVG